MVVTEMVQHSERKSVTKHSRMSVCKSWKSVMTIQFIIRIKYIKLSESDIYIYTYINIHTGVLISP